MCQCSRTHVPIYNLAYAVWWQTETADILVGCWNSVRSCRKNALNLICFCILSTWTYLRNQIQLSNCFVVDVIFILYSWEYSHQRIIMQPLLLIKLNMHYYTYIKANLYINSSQFIILWYVSNNLQLLKSFQFFLHIKAYTLYMLICIYIHFLNLWKVTVQHFNISIIFSIHEMFKSQSNLVYIFIWTVKKSVMIDCHCLFLTVFHQIQWF